MPVALYGCEPWSLVLREESRLRVPENRVVLKIIFRPKRDEVTGKWRKLHNEETNDLYSSPDIIRTIKSRRMRCAGHAALMGERRVYTGFWWGKLRERNRKEDPGIDGRIIIGWVFKKWVVGYGLDRAGSG